VANWEETLAQVREKILRYRGSPIGEQNTKAALVEPVLRALGWDVGDPEEVWREYRRKNTDNPVDYALLILRTPRLFIEAKALGGDLDEPRWASQIMGYAVVSGVEWVVLTNGDEYRVYNSHAPVPVEEKLFRTIRISDDQARTVEALELLSKERMKEKWINILWKAHFVDRQVLTAIEALFASADPDPALVRLLARRLPALSASDIKTALGRARINLDFPVEPVAANDISAARNLHAVESAQATSVRSSEHRKATPWRDVSIQDLIAAGFIQPPLDLKKDYLGRRVTARVESNGRVTYAGKSYSSLSIAGGMARASVAGAPPGKQYPHTNGWIFWRFEDQDGRLKALDELRQRYFQRKPTTVV